MKLNPMYFCRNCNAKNRFDRSSCVQCGRDMRDRLKRALK